MGSGTRPRKLRTRWKIASTRWCHARYYGTKQAEERRSALLEAERSARAEAERTGQMKDEFLATLSHELRTPLSAIMGWAQILGLPTANEKDFSEGIKIIERNARAQAEIIEDLLDMSRIISGKIRLEIQRLDLGAVIRAAMETVQPAADAKDILIRTNIDPTAALISGDPNRLQQVFWNLLSNAVKFTAKGGEVEIALAKERFFIGSQCDRQRRRDRYVVFATCL